MWRPEYMVLHTYLINICNPTSQEIVCCIFGRHQSLCFQSYLSSMRFGQVIAWLIPIISLAPLLTPAQRLTRSVALLLTLYPPSAHLPVNVKRLNHLPSEDLAKYMKKRLFLSLLFLLAIAASPMSLLA